MECPPQSALSEVADPEKDKKLGQVTTDVTALSRNSHPQKSRDIARLFFS